MYTELLSDKYGYSGRDASVLRCFQEAHRHLSKNPAEVFIPLDFGPG